MGAGAVARSDDFEAFYRVNFSRVAASVRTITGPDVADEIAQEALLVSLESWEHVRALDSPLGWVRLVARRMANRHAWRESRRPRAELAAATHDTPVDALIVDELLASVSSRDRAALSMHYLEDLPMSAIADRLACSPAAAKVLVMRARERARKAADGLVGRWVTEGTWSRDAVAAHLRSTGNARHTEIVLDHHLEGGGGRWELTFDDGRYALHRDDGMRLDDGRYRRQGRILELRPGCASGTVRFDAVIDGNTSRYRATANTTPATDGVPDAVWMNLFVEASPFVWSGPADDGGRRALGRQRPHW